MNVNTLLEGASPYKEQQKESVKLVNKWEKSGLLEGLNGHESEKPAMATLLENQARQLVKEASSLGTGATVSTGDSEAYAGVALPLVRRVFGEIVAKDLLSVQPLNLPSGLIFYLDFQYGTGQPGFSTTDGENSIYGANNELTRNIVPEFDSNAPTTTRGLYGAGRFGYSINETSSVQAATSASATFEGVLNLDSEFSASYTGLFGGAVGATSTVRIVETAVSTLNDFDPEGVRAFKISTAAGAAIPGQFPQFTRLVSNGTKLQFVVSAAAGDAFGEGDNVTVEYQKGPDNLDDRGDFQDTISATSVSELDIPEINVQLRLNGHQNSLRT